MNKGVNIPKGWREAKIGEVFFFLRTSSYSRSQTSKASKNALYIHYGDIHKINKLTLDFKKEDILRLNDNIDSSSLDFLQNGDLIIADASEDYLGIGSCSEIKNLNELAVSGLHTFALRPNISFIKIGFSSLLLNSFFVKNYLKKIATGASVLGISKYYLAKTPLLLPPLQEQKAIADILEKWDEAIEKTSKLIEAKKKRFEWLLKNLISKPLNLKNWQKINLGDLGDISSAGVDKKIIDGEEEVFLLNYLDVYRRDKIYANELSHKVTAPKIKLEKCSIKKGDIFFTPSSEVRGDIGLSAVAMEDIERAVYSYHIIRLRPKIEIDLLYSAYAFKGQDFYKQAAMYADGSGQRYVISQNNFRKIEIFLPPLLQQKQIAKTLNTAKKEITILEEILANYKNQKKGLMQKLLTGKIRVLHD